MMRYLDEVSVRAVPRWDQLIAALEPALAAFSSGRVLQPVRNMLTMRKISATLVLCLQWPMRRWD